jgi:hypothetical protein
MAGNQSGTRRQTRQHSSDFPKNRNTPTPISILNRTAPVDEDFGEFPRKVKPQREKEPAEICMESISGMNGKNAARGKIPKVQ